MKMHITSCPFPPADEYYRMFDDLFSTEASDDFPAKAELLKALVNSGIKDALM